MSGPPLPDNDHIARYCPPKTVSDGNVQATAFMLRSNETELSVNWLECLKCRSRAEEIGDLQKVFATKLTVRANARFVVLKNVGTIRETIEQKSSDRRKITIEHEPEAPQDMSHSCVYGLRHQDEEIAEIFVQLIEETHRARP